MKFHKKGQIQQLFIILAAIIVIGVTIFIGIRLIGVFHGTACDADKAGFLRDVKGALDDGAPYGSRRAVKLSTPCDAVALCFVDAGAIGNQNFTSNDSTIAAAVKAGAKDNVFLLTGESTTPLIYDPRVILGAPNAPETSDLCIPAAGGSFAFRTQGYGRYVKVMRE